MQAAGVKRELLTQFGELLARTNGSPSYRPYPKLADTLPCIECSWASHWMPRVERRAECRTCGGKRRVPA